MKSFTRKPSSKHKFDFEIGYPAKSPCRGCKKAQVAAQVFRKLQHPRPDSDPFDRLHLLLTKSVKSPLEGNHAAKADSSSKG